MDDLPDPHPNSGTDAAPAHAAPPARARRARRGWLIGVLALVLLLAGLLAALAGLPGTARGSRLLLSWVPGLTLTGAQGSLWGDFTADRVDYAFSPTQTLTLQPLRWQGLRLAHDAQGWRLQLAQLDIERLALTGRAAADTGAPLRLPSELVLPVGLQIDALRIGRIDADALGDQPVRGLQLALHLGAGRQAQHRIDGLQLQWERLRAQGQLQLQAAAPLNLAADLALAAAPPAPGGSAPAPALPAALGDDWQARLRAHGPLARLTADATLRARGQSLDATAVVQPETPLGVTSLNARAQRFDLAAFSDQWPRTALTGTVAAQLDAAPSSSSTPTSTPATDRPVTLTADLRNEAAGRLDTGALPLRSLAVTARSAVGSTGQGRIDTLTLALGSSTQPAGTVQAQGGWQSATSGTPPAGPAPLRIDLATRWTDVRPALIDARAPALRVGGTLQLGWTSGGSASARGDLRGELPGASPGGAGQPVALHLDAEGTPDQVQVRTLEAVAGTARATAQGQARRSAQGWAAQFKGRLQAFDPSVWLPLPHPAWRRGPHRLDGELQGDLRWPADAAPRAAPIAALGWLAAVQGEAGLQLAPSSVLAGVPIAGQLRYAHTGSAAPQASGRFTLGPGPQPGELTLDGQLDTRDPRGAADRWALRWKLPALAPLSPWLALAAAPPSGTQPAGTVTGLRGDLEGELQVTGRWPQLQASGRLASQALSLERTAQAGEALRGLTAQTGEALRGLTAQWNIGSRPEDRLALDARIAGTTLGNLKLENTHLLLSGTGGAHRLQLATGAVLANEQSAGPRRLQAMAQAEGGWQAAHGAAAASTGTGWGWQGRIAQLEVRDAPQPARPGTGSTTSAATRHVVEPLPWLQLQPTALRWVQQGRQQGRHRELSVDATRLQINDATLALAPIQWQQDGDDGARLTLVGQLEPWAVAPLLARLQPGFGWRGDLRLAGRLSVRATPGRFQADVSLARQSGDLQVQDGDAPAGAGNASTSDLGLTDLRLALQADNGQWRLSEQIVGSRLGRLMGEVRLQAAPAAWVPPASSSLAGQLDLQVAQLSQLGQIGPWLPAGWRVSGALDGQVRLSGQLGAPRLAGELQGRKIAVRNLLEGVDWRDADLRVVLQGERAQLDQFQMLAGTGRLSGSGTAQLGQAPRLDLRLQADRFAVLQRVDRRVVISGDAMLMLDARTTRVNATLKADEGRIDIGQSDAPSLADDVQVRRDGAPASSVISSSAAPGDAATGDGGTRQTQLDIRADLGPAFMLRGRGVNARLAGTLRLTSPNNRLQMTGTVRAVNGNYAAYGQKLSIERGLVNFTGALDNPRLDILALRSDLDEVRVGVAITGTAQGPRVRLYSDPEMSDTDKLSWLMLGRASDGLGGTDVALLQRAAYALLAGESDSPGLVQRLGLDNVSVGQKDDGTVRETVVSLGKQLSRRWYVGYERSLQTTTGSWQLIYRLAQRFTLRAQSGTTENALDLIWTWRWGR